MLRATFPINCGADRRAFVGVALCALICAAATRPAAALQMNVPPPQVITPPTIPQAPQVRPPLRPRIVVPHLWVDPGVARRVLPQEQPSR